MKTNLNIAPALVRLTASVLPSAGRGWRSSTMAVGIAALVVAGFAPNYASGDSAVGEDFSAVVTPVALPGPDSEEPATMSIPLGVGDSLRVAFYGRDDLTSTYRVDEQGLLQIPTIGRFEAAGHSPAAVEQAVRDRAVSVMNRPAYVTITVTERQPIFVSGHVAKPGAFDFRPGMTVMHAVAVAGGTPNRNTGSLLSADALREAARIEVARSELQTLLVRRAHLEAALADRAELEVPEDLVAAVGRRKADRLIEVASGIFERERRVEMRNKAALEVSVKEGEIEVEAYRKELTNIASQRSLRETALIQIRDLSKRGLTTTQRLTESEILLSGLDRDAQAAIANVARSKQGLERSQRDLDNLTVERKLALGKELSAVMTEIWKLQAQIAGSGVLVNHLSSLPVQLLVQDGDPNFSYEVFRRSKDGRLARIEASETTAVFPGDVVRVGIEKDEPLTVGKAVDGVTGGSRRSAN